MRVAQGSGSTLGISVVNLGEVVYKAARRGQEGSTEAILATVDSLPIDLVAVDMNLALSAAALKAKHAVGYLDCFVVALALQRKAVVMTGDPDFRAFDDVVPVEWIPIR